MLVEEGLLKKSEITKIKWFETPDRVDFGRLYHHRQAVLRLAFGRFQNREALAEFCREKEARMNTPGVLSSANWTWRAQKGYLSAPLRKRIYRLTELYGRLGINN